MGNSGRGVSYDYYHYLYGRALKSVSRYLPTIINPEIFKITQQIVSFLGLTEDLLFKW
jgi:hypothetical protein